MPGFCDLKNRDVKIFLFVFNVIYNMHNSIEKQTDHLGDLYIAHARVFFIITRT